jgi:glycosyltransferase involved in cell wall biosynthesis
MGGTSDRDVTLLTGGWDRPYAFGMTTALIEAGLKVDLIAADDLAPEDFQNHPLLKVLTYRPSHAPGAGVLRKALNVLAYYVRLLRYTWGPSPKIFHILWNNGYDVLDRTVLMLYYRLMGKTIVLTAHNVNAAQRDSKDTFLNRLTLAFQYRLCEHVFVHTDQMKAQLSHDFGVPAASVTVVPFGLNNSVPDTALTRAEARERLGIAADERTLLFFGNIAPYKGLEYLVEAFQGERFVSGDYRLIVAGRPKPGFPDYWNALGPRMAGDNRILLKIEYIPDDETEMYFKASDVLVLPYTDVFQSGVLFLGFSFGLPALVADAGSLKDDITEGQNGFVFAPRDAADLARTIERYFSSDLFHDLTRRRQGIRDHAAAAHSWDAVAHLTLGAYAGLVPVSFLQSSVS